MAWLPFQKEHPTSFYCYLSQMNSIAWKHLKMSTFKACIQIMNFLFFSLLSHLLLHQATKKVKNMERDCSKCQNLKRWIWDCWKVTYWSIIQGFLTRAMVIWWQRYSNGIVRIELFRCCPVLFISTSFRVLHAHNSWLKKYLAVFRLLLFFSTSK